MTTRSQQTIAQQIEQAKIDCENARNAYRRGGGTDRINDCNRKLANLQDEFYRVAAGIARDYDRPAGQRSVR